VFIEELKEDEAMEQHFVEVQTMQKDAREENASGSTTNHRNTRDGKNTAKDNGDGEND
jgi:hypothetical protein